MGPVANRKLTSSRSRRFNSCCLLHDPVSERLGAGLQNRLREFESHRDLHADVAQLEECDVANVEVAGSKPVVCSRSNFCACGIVVCAPAFQAGYGGSIPFTRSTLKAPRYGPTSG